MQTEVTVGIIDSRSKEHPDWVQTAINSVKKSCEIYPVKLVVIDNRDRKKTIGYCHNKFVQEADTEWVFLLDDDDWISPDIIATTLYHAKKHPNCVLVNTYMTVFTKDNYATIPRHHKGLIKREYLLKHPFDETLTNGVDRAWFDQYKMRGDFGVLVPYHYGYYYRQHDDHRARPTGNIKFLNESADIHIFARQSNFIEPVYQRLKNEYSCRFDDRKADLTSCKDAKVIWCEFLTEDAINVANFETKAKKILRLHAFEAFTERIFYVDFNKFDKVVFVAEHIKNIVEKRLGKSLPNAIVVPNGVEMNKYTFNPHKELNNKIVYAGSIERKKGIGELIMIAEHFKDFEFHCAGTYQEEDVAEFLRDRKPDNLHFHGQVYNMPEFYQDYSYVINSSLREGCPMAVLEAMACGCKPIVRNWIGSEDQFPSVWLWKGFDDINSILGGDFTPERYRMYIEQLFNFESMYKKFVEIIDVSLSSTDLHQSKDTYSGRNVHAVS